MTENCPKGTINNSKFEKKTYTSIHISLTPKIALDQNQELLMGQCLVCSVSDRMWDIIKLIENLINLKNKCGPYIDTYN